jgi:hypothetical protein
MTEKILPWPNNLQYKIKIRCELCTEIHEPGCQNCADLAKKHRALRDSKTRNERRAKEKACENG